ncbi:SDR family oxidoreductase [Streptomyces sp. NPDC003442]
MTLLITGARGGIGAGLLRRLHESGHRVRAASRAPEKLDLPAGVSAVPAGVRRVVLLSSDSAALPDAEHNALARHHLRVERALRATPLTATVLRPGGFATMARQWAEPVRDGRPVEQAYPDARLDVIHPDDIVDVAELALTGDQLDGETVSLGGPEVLSFRDQARILGQLLNRPIELREPTRERAATDLSGHVPAPLVESVLDYWAALPTGHREAARSIERLTGRPGRPFRRWAADNLDLFR